MYGAEVITWQVFAAAPPRQKFRVRPTGKGFMRVRLIKSYALAHNSVLGQMAREYSFGGVSANRPREAAGTPYLPPRDNRRCGLKRVKSSDARVWLGTTL